MDFILFTVVALSLSLPLVILLTKNKLQSSMFPPGRTGWPIIGESLEFLNTGRRGVPEKFIRDRMQKFSSMIFRTSLLSEATAVMCGPEGNKFLFTNENKLVTVWWPKSFSRIFFPSTESINNGDFINMRKMLAVFINSETLNRYTGVMDTIAKKHLKENWDDKKEVAVFPLSKNYAFSLACKIFMSIDDPFQLAKMAAPFAILSSGTGIISLPINLPGTPFYKAIKASNLVRKYLLEIVKQRQIDLAEGKASPVQDMLSHMLATSDELTKDYEIADKILGLLLGGHGTTSAAITFVVKYLAELPHVYDEVYKEQVQIMNAKVPGELLNWEDIQKMKYSWNVACEVLRLAPPIQGAFRVALSDFDYNGFSVPKGWKLYWSTHSTHKNPIYFPEPEKFDPSRFEGNGPAPYTYVPFGGGPRICPGKEYARLKILVFMHNVVTKFKWENVFLAEKIVVNPMPMPAKGLLVRLQPHVY